ncbi:MAG: aminodeoxychorismate/anthranilate synthase component II [Clostridia bacterium]
MILMIDNYDSFTYNLYQYVGSICEDIKVVRNDKITIKDIAGLSPTHIIISPGPGFPDAAGISTDVVKSFYSHIPVLGVCLGHQAIGEAFGGKVVHAKELVHGKASDIYLENCSLFKDIPNKIIAARYHSLIIEKQSLPNELNMIASTKDGEIMGICHKKYPVYGIQFHPESIITEYGIEILNNFLVDLKR